MKIYTKTGDLGQTSLFGGKRVGKDDARVDAYGNVDELNSWIGLLRDQDLPETTFPRDEILTLKCIQDTLFIIGSQLANDPEKSSPFIPELDPLEIERLEKDIDTMESFLPPLKHFILPGGHPSISFVQISRTVCRRCERMVVSLKDMVEERPLILIYLNRLSDYLFILSRFWTEILGVPEYKWIPNPRT